MSLAAQSGGPIWIPKVYDGRNKSFFFFTYTKDKRPVTPTLVVSTVPTARMKQGDFSELPASQVIYDPADHGWRSTRTPFPGQRHPAEPLQQYLTEPAGRDPEPDASVVDEQLRFRE